MKRRDDDAEPLFATDFEKGVRSNLRTTDKVNREAREGALGYKVNREAREGALGHEGFVADKGISKGAAVFVNNAG